MYYPHMPSLPTPQNAHLSQNLSAFGSNVQVRTGLEGQRFSEKEETRDRHESDHIGD